MKSSPKIVIPITGPLLKYRLDIIREVSPDIKDYLIIFTDDFSYDLYSDHHDFFNFVTMDNYRKKHPFSLEYERFPNFKTEAEFLKKFDTFYGNSTGIYYPWEIHRFVFEYMMENHILNFVITQSDFIFKNDSTIIKEFFDSVPRGSLYAPFMGMETDNSDYVWDKIQEQFPFIHLKYNNSLHRCDGFFRGFYFNNIGDMELFYNIWNEAIQIPIKNKKIHNTPMYFTDFIVTALMQFFAKQRDYMFSDMHDVTYVKKLGTNIGRHFTRVEDTLYAGERAQWKEYNFDYSNTSTIADFIKNNKSQILEFYHPFNTTITDKHVYTRL